MTMEIVTFRVMPGTTVDEVRSASAGVQEFLAGCPGFEKRELFHDGESGQWVDTVRWVDRPSALDAGERIMAFARANWEHNKDVPPEEIEADIAAAIREVREADRQR